MTVSALLTISREHWLDRLAWLDARPSTARVAGFLLPVTMLLLLPTSWGSNEDFYFIQSLVKVAPEQIRPHDVAFDVSNARILSEWLIGYSVLWFGYDGALVLLRLITAGLYALGFAYCITGLRLTVVDALLMLALFLFVGPDIMGGEWLFDGVEPKTFAYALVLLGFGLVFRGRAALAMAALALATWFHFLVGGFWILAALAFLLLERGDVRTLVRPVLLFGLLTLPVLGLLVVDRYVAGAAPVPAHGLDADYIYGIVRSAHHTAPFYDLATLPEWLDGSVFCLSMILAFGFLAAGAGRSFERAVYLWTAGLLGYLLLALVLSWFDRDTSVLGKFFLFRPSSLILVFSLLALLVAFDRAFRDGAGERNRLEVKAAASLVALPLLLWESSDNKLRDLILGDPYADLADLAAFIHEHTPPASVVISDPAVGLQRPALSLPRVIDRPMLATLKITPTNPAGIFQWYELVEFKRRIFAGECPLPGDPPVDYLILIEPAENTTAPCGEIIWRSENFALAELPPANAAGRANQP